MNIANPVVSQSSKQLFWEIIYALSKDKAILIPFEYYQNKEEILNLFPYLEILFMDISKPIAPKIAKLQKAAAKKGLSLNTLKSYLNYSEAKYAENLTYLSVHFQQLTHQNIEEYSFFGIMNLVASLKYAKLIDEESSCLPLNFWVNKSDIILEILAAKFSYPKNDFSCFSSKFLMLPPKDGKKNLQEFKYILENYKGSIFEKLDIFSLRSLAIFFNKNTISPLLFKLINNFRDNKNWGKLAEKWEKTRIEWETSKKNLADLIEIPTEEQYKKNQKNFENLYILSDKKKNFQLKKKQKELYSKLRKFYRNQQKFTAISKKIELKYGLNSFELFYFLEILQKYNIEKFRKNDIKNIKKIYEKIEIIIDTSYSKTKISFLKEQLDSLIVNYFNSQEYYQKCLDRYSNKINPEELLKILRIEKEETLKNFSNSIYQYWLKISANNPYKPIGTLYDFGRIATKLPEMELKMMENSSMLAFHHFLNNVNKLSADKKLSPKTTLKDLSFRSKSVIYRYIPIWYLSQPSNYSISEIGKNINVYSHTTPCQSPYWQKIRKIDTLKYGLLEKKLPNNLLFLFHRLNEIIYKDNTEKLDLFKDIIEKNFSIWQKFIIDYFGKNNRFRGTFTEINENHMCYQLANSTLIDFIRIDSLEDYQYSQTITDRKHIFFISNRFFAKNPTESLESLGRYLEELVSSF